VVEVRESSPATNRDEARVTLLREDHDRSVGRPRATQATRRATQRWSLQRRAANGDSDVPSDTVARRFRR
jgi:hypothetical protein